MSIRALSSPSDGHFGPDLLISTLLFEDIAATETNSVTVPVWKMGVSYEG